MEKHKELKLDLVRKVRKIFADSGLKADVSVSEHEAVVAARTTEGDQCLKAVFHLTTRDPKPFRTGELTANAQKQLTATIKVRPTLTALKGPIGVATATEADSQTDRGANKSKG